MSNITTDQIKALRDETGVSVMQCRKALEEASGNVEKAKIILQKKGREAAEKKSDRKLGAGVIQAYIHATGTVGTMVELSCETDFVAKNEEFKALAYDIAMHITALNPQFLKKEDVSEESRKAASEVFAKEVEGKPENMKAKILEGKLDAYFGEKILLEQPFVKNPDLKIKNLLEGATQKFGEKTQIARFSRFAVGK